MTDVALTHFWYRPQDHALSSSSAAAAAASTRAPPPKAPPAPAGRTAAAMATLRAAAEAAEAAMHARYEDYVHGRLRRFLRFDLCALSHSDQDVHPLLRVLPHGRQHWQRFLERLEAFYIVDTTRCIFFAHILRDLLEEEMLLAFPRIRSAKTALDRPHSTPTPDAHVLIYTTVSEERRPTRKRLYTTRRVFLLALARLLMGERARVTRSEDKLTFVDPQAATDSRRLAWSQLVRAEAQMPDTLVWALTSYVRDTTTRFNKQITAFFERLFPGIGPESRRLLAHAAQSGLDEILNLASFSKVQSWLQGIEGLEMRDLYVDWMRGSADVMAAAGGGGDDDDEEAAAAAAAAAAEEAKTKTGRVHLASIKRRRLTKLLLPASKASVYSAHTASVRTCMTTVAMHARTLIPESIQLPFYVMLRTRDAKDYRCLVPRRVHPYTFSMALYVLADHMRTWPETAAFFEPLATPAIYQRLRRRMMFDGACSDYERDHELRSLNRACVLPRTRGACVDMVARAFVRTLVVPSQHYTALARERALYTELELRVMHALHYLLVRLGDFWPLMMTHWRSTQLLRAEVVRCRPASFYRKLLVLRSERAAAAQQHPLQRLMLQLRLELQWTGEHVPAWLHALASRSEPAPLSVLSAWESFYDVFILERTRSVSVIAVLTSLLELDTKAHIFAHEPVMPEALVLTRPRYDPLAVSERSLLRHPFALLSARDYIFVVLYKQHAECLQRALLPYLLKTNRRVAAPTALPIYPQLTQNYVHARDPFTRILIMQTLQRFLASNTQKVAVDAASDHYDDDATTTGKRGRHVRFATQHLTPAALSTPALYLWTGMLHLFLPSFLAHARMRCPSWGVSTAQHLEMRQWLAAQPALTEAQEDSVLWHCLTESLRDFEQDGLRADGGLSSQTSVWQALHFLRQPSEATHHWQQGRLVGFARNLESLPQALLAFLDIQQPHYITWRAVEIMYGRFILAWGENAINAAERHPAAVELLRELYQAWNVSYAPPARRVTLKHGLVSDERDELAWGEIPRDFCKTDMRASARADSVSPSWLALYGLLSDCEYILVGEPHVRAELFLSISLLRPTRIAVAAGASARLDKAAGCQPPAHVIRDYDVELLSVRERLLMHDASSLEGYTSCVQDETAEARRGLRLFDRLGAMLEELYCYPVSYSRLALLSTESTALATLDPSVPVVTETVLGEAVSGAGESVRVTHRVSATGKAATFVEPMRAPAPVRNYRGSQHFRNVLGDTDFVRTHPLQRPVSDIPIFYIADTAFKSEEDDANEDDDADEEGDEHDDIDLSAAGDIDLSAVAAGDIDLSAAAAGDIDLSAAVASAGDIDLTAAATSDIDLSEMAADNDDIDLSVIAAGDIDLTTSSMATENVASDAGDVASDAGDVASGTGSVASEAGNTGNSETFTSRELFVIFRSEFSIGHDARDHGASMFGGTGAERPLVNLDDDAWACILHSPLLYVAAEQASPHYEHIFQPDVLARLPAQVRNMDGLLPLDLAARQRIYDLLATRLHVRLP